MLAGEVEGGGADAAAGVEDEGLGGEIESAVDVGVHAVVWWSGGGVVVVEVPAVVSLRPAEGALGVGPEGVVVVSEGGFVVAKSFGVLRWGCGGGSHAGGYERGRVF